ncbi:MAG: alcohol dehydrogenase catalytic domain-containing protein [Elusimicrobiota bacterium]
MKALVLERNGVLACRSMPDPVCPDGQCLISVRHAGICDSDMARAYENGAYHYPLVMGHEFSGIVAEAGPGVRRVRRGERVAVFPLLPCFDCRWCRERRHAQCLSYDYYGSRRDGAFAELVAVPEWNVVRLPDEVPLLSGALLELVAVGIHAARRAAEALAGVSRPRVLILGAGVVGRVVACELARRLASPAIHVLDRNAFKREAAARLGFEALDPSLAVGWLPSFLEQTSGGADCVLEATGAPENFLASIEAARPFGSVVWVGNIRGDLPVPRKAVSSILRREIRIEGVWNSHYDPEGKAADDWRAGLEFLRSEDVSSWVTHQPSLEEGAAFLERLHRAKTRGRGDADRIFKAVFKIGKEA